MVEVPTRILREQIGPRLAREAGADFEAPLRERPRAEGSDRRSEKSRGVGPDRHRRERLPNGSPVEARETAGRRDERPKERKRRYFAALRAERDEAERGPRRRLERGAISDRKGREIAIERFEPAREKKGREAARRLGRSSDARRPASKRRQSDGENTGPRGPGPRKGGRGAPRPRRG